MSWFSDLFKEDKQTVNLEPDKTPEQLAVLKAQAEWAQKYGSAYEPGKDYSGQLTAEMTPWEKLSMELLTKYAGSANTGELFGLAKDEVSKTLTDYYNPYTSDYYKSLRTQAGLDTEEAIDTLRRSQGYKGAFFNDSTMRKEGDIRLKGATSLSTLLGSMMDEERARKLSTVPTAVSMDTYENQTAPLNKISALQTAGSLPRTIETENMERLYQDFVRKQTELKGAQESAMGVASTPITYGVKSYESTQPSAFERIMTSVIPLISQAATIAGTGGLGAAAGAGTAAAGAASSAGLNFQAIGSPFLSSLLAA